MNVQLRVCIYWLRSILVLQAKLKLLFKLVKPAFYPYSLSAPKLLPTHCPQILQDSRLIITPQHACRCWTSWTASFHCPWAPNSICLSICLNPEYYVFTDHSESSKKKLPFTLHVPKPLVSANLWASVTLCSSFI